MLGFKKMDEMETEITLKSIKIAWAYTVVFLFIWSVYEYITNRAWGTAFFLLITQNLIFLGVSTILKRRMQK